MRMRSGIGQNILDDASCQRAGRLIFLKYDIDCKAWTTIGSVSAIHAILSFSVSCSHHNIGTRSADTKKATLRKSAKGG